MTNKRETLWPTRFSRQKLWKATYTLQQDNVLWQQTSSSVHSCLQREELKPEAKPPSRDWIRPARSPPKKTGCLEKCLRTSRSDWRSRKPFPPAPDLWVFTALFKAPLHCHYTSRVHGRRGADNAIGTDAPAVIVCVRAAHQLGTVTRIGKEALEEGETLHSKCHAPSWSRSISIHLRSQITANWTPIQVTKWDRWPPLCFWGCVYGVAVKRRGGIAFTGFGEWVSSLLALLSFAYNERVLRNMSVLRRMNHKVCSSTWTQLL